MDKKTRGFELGLFVRLFQYRFIILEKQLKEQSRLNAR